LQHLFNRWTQALSKFRPDDVEEAMRRFAVTATREEARGVVLGDIVALVKQVANDRARAEESTRRQQEQRDMEAARERGETMGWGDVMAAIKQDKPELFQLASTIGRAPEIEKVDPEAQRKLKEFEAHMVAEYGSMDAYREHQRRTIDQQREQVKDLQS
jgi:hypothetical protein